MTLEKLAFQILQKIDCIPSDSLQALLVTVLEEIKSKIINISSQEVALLLLKELNFDCDSITVKRITKQIEQNKALLNLKNYHHAK